MSYEVYLDFGESSAFSVHNDLRQRRTPKGTWRGASRLKRKGRYASPRVEQERAAVERITAKPFPIPCQRESPRELCSLPSVA